MNVQGLNEITKRQSIDEWAPQRQIDVVMVQETRINNTAKEEKQKQMWFFSTSTDFKDVKQVEKKRAAGGRATRAEWKQALENHGVGALVTNKLVKDIEEVEPVNGRLMKVVMDSTPRLHVINGYAPQGGRGSFRKRGEERISDHGSVKALCEGV